MWYQVLSCGAESLYVLVLELILFPTPSLLHSLVNSRSSFNFLVMMLAVGAVFLVFVAAANPLGLHSTAFISTPLCTFTWMPLKSSPSWRLFIADLLNQAIVLVSCNTVSRWGGHKNTNSQWRRQWRTHAPSSDLVQVVSLIWEEVLTSVKQELLPSSRLRENMQ